MIKSVSLEFVGLNIKIADVQDLSGGFGVNIRAYGYSVGISSAIGLNAESDHQAGSVNLCGIYLKLAIIGIGSAENIAFV